MPDPQSQGSTISSSPPSLQEGLTQFLTAKSKGDESGNYRRNANRVITRWIDWLEQRDITDFEQLPNIAFVDAEKATEVAKKI